MTDTTAFLSEASMWMPDRLIESAWLEHAPFAFWLIEQQRPHIVVELGAHNGFSYSAFCQAIDRLHLTTRAYAIDTWKGDEHAGFYGEEIFAELAHYHGQRYAAFSSLVRSTFDEALPHFAEGSIDLLHVDGRHFYDDVRHDFDSWVPKLSNRAIVLFHDTNVRARDFGVSRLWGEIARTYPSFEFFHGHGLGVLGVGPHQPERLRALFATAGQERNATAIRATYARLGQSIGDRLRIEHAEAATNARAQEADALRSQLALVETRAAEAEKALGEKAAEAANAIAHAAALRMEMEAATAKAASAAAAADASAQASEAARQSEAAAHEQRATIDRLGAQLAHFEARILEAERRLLSSRYLFPAVWRKVRNAPRDWSRSIRRSLRKRRRSAADGSGGPGHPGAATESDYARWIANRDYDPRRDRERLAAAIRALKSRPLISVIMPVYNTPAELLEAAISSVLSQIYENWELCIADDHSTAPHVRPILARHVQNDPRIKVVYQAENGNISRASNAAFALATGEWIAPLDHDDILREQALAEVALEISRHPDAEIIYSDEDKISVTGERYDPYFKPDFSRELFRSYNYLNHLTVHRAANIRAVGGWRAGFEGSQDYDLNLRIFERIDAVKIRHIPKVLYHWRAVPGSTALAADEKHFAYDAGLRALQEHVQRVQLPAVAEAMPERFGYRLRMAVPEPHPLVSLIIPTRDGVDLLRRCIGSIREKTTYDNYEIIIVDNGSAETATLDYLRDIEGLKNIRVLRYDKPFNYSAINNFAAAQANGTVLGLVNSDIEVISPDWLTEMVSWAGLPDVGCVGAKLYYPNDTIQHAGVILGVGGVAGHSHLFFPREHPGYFARLKILQNLLAVTAACLVVRKAIYEQVGGLNEVDLKVAFNDVDFCLRVHQTGYRNVWTPFAELYHLESASRGQDMAPERRARFAREVNYMTAKWDEPIQSDPYYSPHLTVDRSDFSIRATPGAV